MFEPFKPSKIELTKYLFFTGKGGVGKTSLACATAVQLADNGKNVMLISTDPAPNLQDVFETELNNMGVAIAEVKGLTVANLDPVKAAAEYRENVVAPYRGKLPESVLANMEEQLSGSCTVEIAAFNEFSGFITDEKTAAEYDHIIFDTAPTGHTLRMLQLPSAWSGFISESTHGASCLGQLSGLDSKKAVYKKAVETLADAKRMTLVLVTRPEETPIKEAERASGELSQLEICSQIMVINGLLTEHSDEVSNNLHQKQQKALTHLPHSLDGIAYLFLFVVFKGFITSELATEYLAGAVLLGAAPCTAMVFVWSTLTKGNPAYTVVQVATNDIIILIAFVPIVKFLLGVSNVSVPYSTLFLSIFLFVVIPLAGGIFTRLGVVKSRGKEYFENTFVHKFDGITTVGLLLTLVLIFASQAEVILSNPLHILLIAVPLIIQTFFIFFLAFGVCKAIRLSFDIAAPAEMIGASNFFELAVAVAVALFGTTSPAALATTVGVLTEVPVMLTLVKIANRSEGRFHE